MPPSSRILPLASLPGSHWSFRPGGPRGGLPSGRLEVRGLPTTSGGRALGTACWEIAGGEAWLVHRGTPTAEATAAAVLAAHRIARRLARGEGGGADSGPGLPLDRRDNPALAPVSQRVLRLPGSPDGLATLQAAVVVALEAAGLREGVSARPVPLLRGRMLQVRHPRLSVLLGPAFARHPRAMALRSALEAAADRSGYELEVRRDELHFWPRVPARVSNPPRPAPRPAWYRHRRTGELGAAFLSARSGPRAVRLWRLGTGPRDVPIDALQRDWEVAPPGEARAFAAALREAGYAPSADQGPPGEA